MNQVLIDSKGLSKKYPSNNFLSLDSIDLQIYRSEKFGIFGPNGAGKTTLISLMCGIIQPSEGSITCFMQDEVSMNSISDKIGYVPQDFAFFQELTPVQNLSYFGGLYGIPKVELSEKIDFLLNKLSLDHVRDVKIQTFSGGMKRRINLAIGLINDPEILFLDEPTVGVDVQSKFAIVELLQDLNMKGTTIIYTSHHLKEAEDFCDRIALLDEGKIIAIGPLTELVRQNNVSDLEELMIHFTGKKLRD
jgi:ABC-2 type transport system ATP-binding protein